MTAMIVQRKTAFCFIETKFVVSQHFPKNGFQCSENPQALFRRTILFTYCAEIKKKNPPKKPPKNPNKPTDNSDNKIDQKKFKK